jgi:hypothetical protein
MVLDALNQLGQSSDLSGDDDAGVLTTVPLPFGIQGDEIDHVEGEDRAALGGGVGELILIRNTLIGSPGSLATEGVESSAHERWGQSGVDMFISEERDAATGH